VLKSHIYEFSLLKNKAMICVTYSPEEFMSIKGRYIMLFDGEIVFDGQVGDFLMSHNEYLIQYKLKSSQGPMEIN
jgi:ABC-type transporter Mla maintaining outer membrane lipid asymmetry ATPase subunit MlaF